MSSDLEIYNTSADQWWSGNLRFLRTLHNIVPPRMKYFSQQIDSWDNQTVLDLGCGGGFMSEALAREGASVIGVDPCSAAIESARRHAHSVNLPINYRVGSGEEIPLENDSVDFVVCVDVLEHISNLDKALSEIRRVLKPGGIFFFDTINRTFLAKLLMVYLGEYTVRLLPIGTHDPKMFIKPKELKQKLSALGFNVAPFVGLGPAGMNRKFDFTFAQMPFTWIMYMGHCQ